MNNGNKKFLAIIGIILLFIPTYIAIGYFISEQNGTVTDRSVDKIELCDLAGTEYMIDRQNKVDDEFISLLTEMTTTARSVSSLPDPVKDSPYFTVRYDKHGDIAEYHYYISANPSEAYYVDQTGAAYSISKVCAEKFLESPYAISIYPGAAFPRLSVGKTEIVPNTASWAYKIYSGEYINPAINTKTDEQTASITADAISLDFSAVPDSIEIEIKNAEGKVVFNDAYDKLSNLIIDERSVFTAFVKAKWYESSTLAGRGEATYQFFIDAKAPAAFYLSHPTVEIGSFVMITAQNVDVDDEISITSEPALTTAPVFYADGEYMRALLPVTLDTAAGKYKLTATVGQHSQTMNLEIVAARNFRNFENPVPTDKAALRSEENLKAFADALDAAFAERQTTVYFSADPVFGIGIDAPLTKGFGHYRYTNNDTANMYRSDTVEYNAQSGTALYATNAGKVVYAASTAYGGNTVVIDHGLGLKTIYMHMGKIDVKVGDVLNKGAVIGSTGATGFASDNTGYIGMLVENIPVSPYLVWSDGDGINMLTPGN